MASLGAASVTLGEDDTMRWLTFIGAAGAATTVALLVLGGMPIDLPMPTHAIGMVDPTCGLTRGSQAISRGDFATAWRYNPASFLVIGLGLFGIGRWIYGRLTRRWVNLSVRVTTAGWVSVGAVFLLWWAYQQTNSDYIIHARYP